MRTISTHVELAMLAVDHPDATLRHLLSVQAERLADYDLSEIATLVLIEPHDTLDDLDNALGRTLASLLPVELVEQHGGWHVATFLLSDWGDSIVVYVPENADPTVLALCEAEGGL